jgi:error-prone DNA polymerase
VAFACALLNSQPMGFYAPAQIVGDARRHGARVRPVDVSFSDWDCTLEALSSPSPAAPSAVGSSEAGNRGEQQRFALRLGLRMVKGLPEREGRALVAARGAGYPNLAARGSGYPDLDRLQRAAGLGRGALAALARADAFTSLGLNRRSALWAVQGLDHAPPLELFAVAGVGEHGREPAVRLPEAAVGEQVAGDYHALGLSLKAHPLQLLRPKLTAEGYTASDRLPAAAHGRRVWIAGIVTTRQRPGSANGVMFITIEDETGPANIIVWPGIVERYRKLVLGARLLGARGPVQREGEVIHIVAEHLADLTPLLGALARNAGSGRNGAAGFDVRSRDFH